MHQTQLYLDLLALGLVLVGALLVAVLVWLLTRRYRHQVADSVECSPPKLCIPAPSPTDDGSSLPTSPEPQMSTSDPSNRQAAPHKAPSPSTVPDTKDGGSEQRPNPKTDAEPEAEDRTNLPTEANHQQKERQLTKETPRKKGNSRSGDEKSCSSNVKRKSKHRVEAAHAKPAVVSRPAAEAGGVVAATVADGDAVSLNISPTGAKVPASDESPASQPTPVTLYSTATAGSQFASPTATNGENPPGLVAAAASSVPSSTTSLLVPQCEPLPPATAAPSDPAHSPSRRRRLTRSKESRSSGSSRRSDHHREPQAHHPPAQLGAIPRDHAATQATEDAAQRLSQASDVKAPGTAEVRRSLPAVTAEVREKRVHAGALFACSPLESRGISGTH